MFLRFNLVTLLVSTTVIALHAWLWRNNVMDQMDQIGNGLQVLVTIVVYLSIGFFASAIFISFANRRITTESENQDELQLIVSTTKKQDVRMILFLMLFVPALHFIDFLLGAFDYKHFVFFYSLLLFLFLPCFLLFRVKILIVTEKGIWNDSQCYPWSEFEVLLERNYLTLNAKHHSETKRFQVMNLNSENTLSAINKIIEWHQKPN